MLRIFYLVFTFFYLYLLPLPVFSQSVGLGTNTPHSSAFFEVRSTTKGVLIPRMSEGEMNAITDPIEGLIVFQTDGEFGYRYYDGANWITLGNIYTTPPFVNSIPVNSVTNAHFKKKGIASFNIKDDRLNTDHFQDGSITGGKILPAQITKEKLKDGAIDVSDFQAPPPGTKSNSYLVWDGAAALWRAVKLPSSKLSYRGSWDAGGNTPDLFDKTTAPSAGDFFIVKFGGTRNIDKNDPTVKEAFRPGDWVFYDSDYPEGSRWRKLTVSHSVTSVFGRDGDVTAQNNDYSWEQLDFTSSSMQGMLSDVITSSAIDGQLIRWDATRNQWIPGLEYGITSNPLNTEGIDDESIGGLHIDGGTIPSSKFASGAIVARTLADRVIGDDKLKDRAIAIQHLEKDVGDQNTLIYNASSGAWEYRLFFLGLNFRGIWDPELNLPEISDTKAGPKDGDYYISAKSTIAGTVDGRGSPLSVNAGNWVIYTTESGRSSWKVIDVSNPVNSVFGRTGVILPEKNDYAWSQIKKTTAELSDISDVELVTPSTGDIIAWDTTSKKFINSNGYGSSALKVDSAGISRFSVQAGVINADQIGTLQIKDSAVVTADIADISISSVKISDQVVEGRHIEDLSLDSNKIVDYTLSQNHFGDEAVEENNFADSSVTSSDLSDGSIVEEKIVRDAISDPEKIFDGTIKSDKIVDGAITGDKISDEAVPGSAFVDDAITAIKVKDKSIETLAIKDLGIEERDLSENMFDETKFADLTITGDKLADGQISAIHLVDEAVEGSKLGDRAVTGVHIIDGEIISDKIANVSINTLNFADNTVVSSKIEGGGVLIGATGGTINSYAALELRSSSKGFLPPRLSASEIETLEITLTNGEDGLMVYDTDNDQFYVWSGSSWLVAGQRSTCTESVPCPESEDIWKNAKSGDFITFKGLVYGVVSFNGDLWLDRNLGATALPTDVAYNDQSSRGDYYQWGREADGHEKNNSTTSGTKISSSGASNNFIVSNENWRSAPDNNLWQLAGGAIVSNNPCPPGWRVPEATVMSGALESIIGLGNKQASKFKFRESPLRIIGAGYRSYVAGTFFSQGVPDGDAQQELIFWTSTPIAVEPDKAQASVLVTEKATSSPKLNMPTYKYTIVISDSKAKANGYPVRCVKVK